MYHFVKTYFSNIKRADNKPSSVKHGYLSRQEIASLLKPLFVAHRAGVSPQSALLRIGFTGFQCLQRKRWALTSPFHPYRINRRYISVALSL